MTHAQPKRNVPRFHSLLSLGIPGDVAERIAGMRPYDKPGIVAAKRVDAATVELTIYEAIGFDWWTGDGYTPQKLADELSSLGSFDHLIVKINSNGGEVFDGMTLHNQIAALDATVEVVIEGIAASAASIVAMAGDTISMYDNATMMIHKAATVVAGNSQDMLDMADVLDRIDRQISNVYATRSGGSSNSFFDLMSKDTYLDAAESLDLGLITDIVSATPTPSDKGKSATADNDPASEPKQLIKLPPSAKCKIALQRHGR